jgi:hypothetical protein
VLWSGNVTLGHEIPCADYVCDVPFSQGTELHPGGLYETFPSEVDCFSLQMVGADCSSGPSVPWAPNACNVLMNTNRTVSLQHVYLSYLDVTRPSHGRISITDTSLNCGSPDSGAPPYDDWCHTARPVGTPVTVVATPAPGYQFTGWTGAASPCGTNAACTLSLSVAAGHLTISALFNTPPPPPVCTPNQQRACCVCPPGRCSDPGTQTCKSDGSAWGRCLGFTCGGPGSLTELPSPTTDVDEAMSVEPLSSVRP